MKVETYSGIVGLTIVMAADDGCGSGVDGDDGGGDDGGGDDDGGGGGGDGENNDDDGANGDDNGGGSSNGRAGGGVDSMHHIVLNVQQKFRSIHRHVSHLAIHTYSRAFTGKKEVEMSRSEGQHMWSSCQDTKPSLPSRTMTILTPCNTRAEILKMRGKK